MRSRRVPLLGIGVLAIGGVLCLVHWGYFSRRMTRDASLGEIKRGEVKVGQAIRIPTARIGGGSLRVPELDRPWEGADRYYRYVVAHDVESDLRLPIFIFRTTFLQSRTEGSFFVTELRGTVRETPPAERQRLLRDLPQELRSPRDVELYLDEMTFPPVSILAVVTAVFAALLSLLGIVLAVQELRPRRASAAPRDVPAPRTSRPLPERAKAAPAEKGWVCAGCGTESSLASRSCSLCKLPVEVEYYLAAALPLEGFDRLVPIITGALQVNDYQARQPLARVHTPVPYQHLDGFHVRGSSSTSPFRLACRGIPSLVAARALAAAFSEKAIEATVIGSDELQKAPAPRRATGLEHDEEAITFVFEAAGEREVRRIPWRSLALVVFSAAAPMRGSLTMMKDLREGPAVDPASYLVDVYERENPEAVRISVQSFFRWEALKMSGSERPADRFGRLMELLEGKASQAEFQYVSGLYRGPKSEWRMNYYSRFAWLVGEKTSWSKTDGPPRLEGYEVLEKLGEGGMGAVYRGRQKKLGRLVALKVIAGHLAAQKTFVARFQAEARAVATLTHPNIVQVIDLAESAGRHFIVMELVEGRTLLRIIRDRGRIGEAEALRIGLQVASALDHAWQRGILHRDVKPENIFVTPEGVAKLGDWGLAKDLDEDLGLTATGTAIGTPYYMSPEQARARKDLDVRSDLYSLGATIYHAIAGVPPFRGTSPIDVISKHLSAPVPDLRSQAPQASEATAVLLKRLLAKGREERPVSGAELAAEIEVALRAVEREAVLVT